MADENVTTSQPSTTNVSQVTQPSPNNTSASTQTEKIVVDGKEYTPEVIKRISQQASQANRFAELGYGEALKQGLTFEELKNSVKATPEPKPTNQPDTTQSSFNEERFKQMIDNRVGEALTAAEHRKDYLLKNGSP
jgi:hypothetical protein